MGFFGCMQHLQNCCMAKAAEILIGLLRNPLLENYFEFKYLSNMQELHELRDS